MPPTIDPAALRATCSCGHELWKERGGQYTLANRILKLVDGQLRAKCPECASEVEIPWLRLTGQSPRFVMRLDTPPTT